MSNLQCGLAQFWWIWVSMIHPNDHLFCFTEGSSTSSWKPVHPADPAGGVPFATARFLQRPDAAAAAAAETAGATEASACSPSRQLVWSPRCAATVADAHQTSGADISATGPRAKFCWKWAGSAARPSLCEFSLLRPEEDSELALSGRQVTDPQPCSLHPLSVHV